MCSPFDRPKQLLIGGALLGVMLFASPGLSAAAQRREKAAASGWKATYPPNLGDFNTAAERAAAMAIMEEIEGILWRVPELARADPAVRAALWKAYQTLDWAALRRIVDRPW